jgi:hypothetical protein
LSTSSFDSDNRDIFADIKAAKQSKKTAPKSSRRPSLLPSENSQTSSTAPPSHAATYGASASSDSPGDTGPPTQYDANPQLSQIAASAAPRPEWNRHSSYQSVQSQSSPDDAIMQTPSVPTYYDIPTSTGVPPSSTMQAPPISPPVVGSTYPGTYPPTYYGSGWEQTVPMDRGYVDVQAPMEPPSGSYYVNTFAVPTLSATPLPSQPIAHAGRLYSVDEGGFSATPAAQDEIPSIVGNPTFTASAPPLHVLSGLTARGEVAPGIPTTLPLLSRRMNMQSTVPDNEEMAVIPELTEGFLKSPFYRRFHVQREPSRRLPNSGDKLTRAPNVPQAHSSTRKTSLIAFSPRLLRHASTSARLGLSCATSCTLGLVRTV